MERQLRKRRSVLVALIMIVFVLVGIGPGLIFSDDQPVEEAAVLAQQNIEGSELASDVLDSLLVRGRAPKTGYSRSEFGDGWAQIGGCDVRNIMLARGLTDKVLSEDNCVVLSGKLQDPYTGKTIFFVRGRTTSSKVQIDHVVALSDSWQKGAQGIDYEERLRLANDPLNLLAVDGPANQKKGDSDAASWLPSNKGFRCRYVARQVAVKAKYGLWVTEAERAAMKRVINGCGDQVTPIEE